MVPHRSGRRAGRRAAGDRAGRRRARHAVPRPGPPPGMERPAAQRSSRCGLRLEGRSLAAIHSATANQKEVERRFASDDIFYAIRLEPYLVATAAAHPDLEANLLGLLARTAITKLCLVHGDVSPKNILVGPRGPVFLDAECAWYGDPAFDLAFCLNHLLLKCLWVPQAKSAFLNCFAALRGGYLERMSYEDPRSLEARTAALLPALLLARVDGKSPVEYLTDGKDLVRRVARALLAQPPTTLGEIQKAWQESSR